MPKINILLGPNDVEAFEDGDFSNCDNWTIHEYEFATEAEIKAFVKGLNVFENRLTDFPQFSILYDKDLKEIDDYIEQNL